MVQGINQEFSRKIYVSFAMTLFLVGIIFSSAMLLYGVRKKDKFSGFWGPAFLLLYIFSFLLFQPVIFRAFNFYVEEDSIKFYDNKLKRDNSFIKGVIVDRMVQIARDYYGANGSYPENQYIINEVKKDNIQHLFEQYTFSVLFYADSVAIKSVSSDATEDTAVYRATLLEEPVHSK